MLQDGNLLRALLCHKKTQNCFDSQALVGLGSGDFHGVFPVEYHSQEIRFHRDLNTNFCDTTCSFLKHRGGTLHEGEGEAAMLTYRPASVMTTPGSVATFSTGSSYSSQSV